MNSQKIYPPIHVCDAIMGSGKTCATIQFMNSHPERRYLYITPLLDEDNRIFEACPALHFARPGLQPTKRLVPNRATRNKRDDVLRQIKAGQNIATTHALFQVFTPEILDALRQQHYTLIIDEEITVLFDCPFKQDDFKVLEHAGVFQRDADGHHVVKDIGKVQSSLWGQLIAAAKTRRLCYCGDQEWPSYIWSIDPSFLTLFDEVYILTYLFQSSALSVYLSINDVPYDKVFVARNGDNYEFCDQLSYIPSYVGHLSQMIRICDDPSLNALGEAPNSLSTNKIKTAVWKETRLLKEMKSCLRRFFTEYVPEIPGEQRMWSTFAVAKDALMRNGWKAGFVPCNHRGTNKFRNRTALAYMLELSYSPKMANFLRSNGQPADSDTFALSMMVQWIWRSAIRDGKPIVVYVPSLRMRNLLVQWIQDCEDLYTNFVNQSCCGQEGKA